MCGPARDGDTGESGLESLMDMPIGPIGDGPPMGGTEARSRHGNSLEEAPGTRYIVERVGGLDTVVPQAAKFFSFINDPGRKLPTGKRTLSAIIVKNEHHERASKLNRESVFGPSAYVRRDTFSPYWSRQLP